MPNILSRQVICLNPLHTILFVINCAAFVLSHFLPVCVYFYLFFSNGGGGDVGGDDDDGTQVSEAGRLVLTQNLLCNLSFSVLEGQYFLAPLSSAALVAMSFVYELPKAFAAAQESEGRNPLEAIVAAPHLFGLAAALGVVVNYLG